MASEFAHHPVREQEDRWETAVSALLGPDAEIISVSRWIGDSRVYRRGDRVAVIRSVETVNKPEVNDLNVAQEALSRLGLEAQYVNEPPWEALRISCIEGRTLESRLMSLSLRTRLRILLKIVSLLHELHSQGIAHRDLRFDNVLLEPTGKISLIDFDCAQLTSARRAALADWIGLPPFGRSPNSFPKFAVFTLVPKVQTLGRRARFLVRGTSPIAELPLDDDLQLLGKAWRKAMHSSANAPGQGLCYYALTYKNWHFPGERPWHLRWEAIRRHVAFDGKRVLDLGTNLGLLPAFALLHGAKDAIGIDVDAEILEAAALIAEAFGVRADFQRLDIGTDSTWVSAAHDADIVVAMSVLDWIPTSRSILEVLRPGSEIIYEGHDPIDVELAKLRRSGYCDPRVLLESERGRFLLHARKQ